MQEELKSVCRALSIGSLLRRKREVDYETAIDTGDVVEDLIKDYCTQICGMSAATLKEYQSWRINCYDKRKSAIHKGKLDYSLEDVVQAFEACEKYKQAIGKLLKGL